MARSKKAKKVKEANKIDLNSILFDLEDNLSNAILDLTNKFEKLMGKEIEKLAKKLSKQK